MRKRFIAALIIGSITSFSVLSVCAEERATEAEALAMVKKAVAHYKALGEKAYIDFSAPSKMFFEKDTYITVTSPQGVCLAHGKNEKLVGKDLLNMKDPDGKAFIKEMVELGKKREKFSTDYKFTDPMTKKVLPKRAYCEKAGEALICAGVYKAD